MILEAWTGKFSVRARRNHLRTVFSQTWKSGRGGAERKAFRSEVE